MRERLMRRLSAVRTFVLARLAASPSLTLTSHSSAGSKGGPGEALGAYADRCGMALRRSYSLVTCGAALQVRLVRVRVRVRVRVWVGLRGRAAGTSRPTQGYF